jgi:hypothetical protein
MERRRLRGEAGWMTTRKIPFTLPACLLARAMTLAACLGVVPLAHAHHSFAMFDPNRAITLRGVVKEFRWTNPHVFIQVVAAVEGEGDGGEWSIEMTSPEHLARAGWKPGMLKGGDAVVLIVHPLRDGKRGGQFLSGTGPSGAPLGTALPKKAADPSGDGK